MVVHKFLKCLVTRTTDTLINGKHGQGAQSTPKSVSPSKKFAISMKIGFTGRP